MRSHMIRTIALTAAALVLATSAQAQGRGKAKSKQQSVKIKDDDRRNDGKIIRDANGDIVRIDRRVPPGLAKKPGQMPPGQYKKRYNTHDGASVLSDIMRQRGYDVVRIVPTGGSQYVFYRLNDGAERRAIVRLGEDRLRFSNVPTVILQAVLARLY
jgi:hypothetical protein